MHVSVILLFNVHINVCKFNRVTNRMTKRTKAIFRRSIDFFRRSEESGRKRSTSASPHAPDIPLSAVNCERQAWQHSQDTNDACAQREREPFIVPVKISMKVQKKKYRLKLKLFVKSYFPSTCRPSVEHTF